MTATRTLTREPEPTMVMNEPAQVEAYVAAGRRRGTLGTSYLFHAARISQVIQGAKNVVDFACGPATLLAEVAALNPHITFLGADLSENMLRHAQSHVESLGLSNVRFALEDITALPGLADHSADAVISTMSLHQLPSRDHLRACFEQVTRVLRPGGAVYLADFGLVKSLQTVTFMSQMDAPNQPGHVTEDYERSLRAAFQLEDFKHLAEETLPAHVRVYTTFAVPFMVVIKTRDHALPRKTRRRLAYMRSRLEPRYCRELDDLRRSFSLGGLRNDPFRFG
ncbi:MAG: class I SAM-dependent methyltransferase [Candidatus Omnitrophica bacterium]|nr:class I SAM-dependent methyltransferase [Candidatus Omnitrophota bacterium]